MIAMDSLIERDSKQLELIPSSEMPGALFAEDEAEHHEFTGARLFARDPERYQTIVSLLAENLGILRIARLMKVSPNTVMAIRDREEHQVDIVKERVAKLCRGAAQMCAEGILEDLANESKRAKVSARDKAVILGIMVEKYQLLTGGATGRLEHVAAEPAHDDYARLLAAALTGCCGERAAQKAAAAGTAAGAQGQVVDAEYSMEAAEDHQEDLRADDQGAAPGADPGAEREGKDRAIDS